MIIDFETKSEVDLLLVGAWNYSVHPTTELYCMAHKIGDDKTELITDFNYSGSNARIGRYVKQGLPVVAFNSYFEYCIWNNILHKRYGWPSIKLSQMRCLMARSSAMALPRSLEGVGSSLELPIEKSKEGRRIMLQMCKPKKPSKKDPSRWYTDPEKFEKLYDYCVQDVDVSHLIHEKVYQLTDRELQIWKLDQEINHRGIKVDIDLINRCCELVNKHIEFLTEELQTLTKGEIETPNQRDKILKFLNNSGCNIEDLRSDTVYKYIEEGLTKGVTKRILEIRRDCSKASVKKLFTLKNMICEDGRIRDQFVYHRAHTGRWGGKGVQLHNFPRGIPNLDINACIESIMENEYHTFNKMYPDVLGSISSVLRACLISDEGKKLLVGDYAGIELRVLMWLANEFNTLRDIENGNDIYVEMAKDIYSKEDISKEDRQLGKQAILGCGYNMGVKKFGMTCESYGIKINKTLANKAVKAYRNRFKNVVHLWEKIEHTAKLAIQHPDKSVSCGRITWKVVDNTLLCRLPSGKCLFYHEPKIEKKGRYQNITYMGISSPDYKWKRHTTYGGKLVENVVQAISRELLCYSMELLNKNEFNIVMHVHDEIVCEEGPCCEPNCPEQMCDFKHIMECKPEWAKGLPIEVEAFECRRYKK